MYSLLIDGKPCDCSIKQDSFTYRNAKTEVSIAVDDIIGLEGNESSSNGTKKGASRVHFIKRRPGKPEWKKATLKVSGNDSLCHQFLNELQGHFQKVYEKRPKRLLVLINPIGGKATAKEDYKKIVQPLFELANLTCDVIVSERAKHLPDVIATYDWSSTDAIVLLGGDGTCSEVFNAALKRIQTEKGKDINDSTSDIEKFHIPIAIIPTGTGNGLAKDLYDCYDITTAALYLIKGVTRPSHVNGIYCDGKLVSYSCLLFCYGLFGDMIYYTERKRWMRRARYVLMPAWTICAKTYRNFDARLSFRRRKRETESAGGATSEPIETDETLEGHYLNVMFIPSNIFFQHEKMKSQAAVLIFHNCRSWHFFGIMKAMMTDGDLSGYSERVTVKAAEEMTFKVTQIEEHPLNLNVNLDGESHQITKKEFLCRNFSEVVTLFGSKGTFHIKPPEANLVTDRT